MPVVRFDNEEEKVEIGSTQQGIDDDANDVNVDIYFTTPSYAVRRLLLPWETRLTEFRRPLQFYSKKKAGKYKKSMNPSLELNKKMAQDIFAGDEHKYTLLHYCAAQTDSEMLVNLLPKVEAVDSQDEDLKTPLHYAVLVAQKQNVIKLMEKGANPNIKDEEGLTACMYAAFSGQLECLQVLFSSAYKHPGQARMESNQGLTALHYAALQEDTECLQFLLQNKNQLNINIDAKTNQEETALHLAALSMNAENVTLLLSSGASVNVKSQGELTVYHYSAYLWDVDSLKALLECPSSSCFLNTSAKEGTGKTALHFSCMKNSSIQERSFNQVECVEYLVRFMLDEIDFVDESKITALGYAVQHDKTLSAILIRHGADMNGTQSDDGIERGIPPLHLASFKNHVPCLTFLLKQRNINKNQCDYTGRTAVHVAVMEGNADALDTLLYFGAVSDTPFKGRTPLQIASEQDPDLSRILIQYAIMAQPSTMFQMTRTTNCIFKPKTLLGSIHEDEIDIFYKISQRFNKKNTKSIFLLPATQAFINLKRRMLRPLTMFMNLMTILFLIFGLMFLTTYGYCLSECMKKGDFDVTPIDYSSNDNKELNQSRPSGVSTGVRLCW